MGKLLMPRQWGAMRWDGIAADSVYTISPKWWLNVRANYQQLTGEYALTR